MPSETPEVWPPARSPDISRSDAVRFAHQPRRFRSNLVPSKLPPGDEKLLLRRKPVHVSRTRLALERFLVREKRNLRSAEISDTLPQHQLPVVMHVFLNEVMIELVRDARTARLKIFEI